MSATDSPRLASCSATDVPTMPAPKTIASVRCAMSALAENLDAPAYRIRTRRCQAWLICRGDRVIHAVPGALDGACRARRSVLLAWTAGHVWRLGNDLHRHLDAAAC